MRVRFSPSPTQDLALGGVRIALYNWLLARRERGTFVLRIENLDAPQDRGDAVMDALRWCGLTWDEGPHLESERRELYDRYARELESRGRATRIAGVMCGFRKSTTIRSALLPGASQPPSGTPSAL